MAADGVRVKNSVYLCKILKFNARIRILQRFTPFLVCLYFWLQDPTCFMINKGSENICKILNVSFISRILQIFTPNSKNLQKQPDFPKKVFVHFDYKTQTNLT